MDENFMTPVRFTFEQTGFIDEKVFDDRVLDDKVLDDKVFAQLTRSIDNDGYAVISDVFSSSEIAEARQYIEDELNKRRGQYFSFVGSDPVRGTLLEQIGKSPAFQALFARLSSHIMGRRIEPDAPYQVLRVLAGQTGRGQSMLFHYDAYALTALVPIAIPKSTDELCGDLIIYPNLRSIRSNVVFNVLEKTVLQNSLAQKFFATKFAQRLLKAKILRMDPGNVYFFRGYQTLHANEPCNPESLRATALFHFADPHQNSPLTSFIKSMRIRHEERKASSLVS
jgi:hypothetical protein